MLWLWERPCSVGGIAYRVVEFEYLVLLDFYTTASYIGGSGARNNLPWK